MKRFPTERDEEAEGLVPDEESKLHKPHQSSFKSRFNWLHPAVIIVIALIIISGLFLIISHFRAKTDDFAKPLTDQRKYETFSLSNGLKVLAISDPSITTSAVSLSLKVGSFADPQVMPGLAHFLEHLVFLGSEKFPNLDSYTKFVQNRGGANNAYTAHEETNFYFKVPTSSLQPALDMFLHMFVDPIFTREWAVAEVESVDSEYKMDLQNDAWKFAFALGLASNPRSPMSKFTIGSTDSLVTTPESNNVDIVNQVQQFFDTFYSGGLMHMVILHNESTSDLKSSLEPQFSQITQKRMQKPSYDSLPKPFAEEYSNKLFQFLTAGSDTTVHLVFSIDSSLPYTEVDPVNYLHTLLNYESPGSLVTVLKNSGWVLEFYSQSAVRASSFEIIDVQMTLTEEGKKNIAEITRVFLGYLDLIKKHGLSNELFNQFSFITKYIFQYSQYKDEEEDIGNEIRTIASNMGIYPSKYVLAGDKVLFNFDKSYMEQFIQQLNPDNLMIFVSDPNFEITAADSPPDITPEQANVLIETISGVIADAAQQPVPVSANADNDDGKPKIYLGSVNRNDPVYKMDYSVNSLSSDFLQSIHGISYQNYPELALPGPNKYVPSKFEIAGSTCTGRSCTDEFIADRQNTVSSVVSNTNKVWYLLERSFGAPLTTCYIRYNTASLETNSKHLAASGILGELNNLVLNKEIHEIQYAGNNVVYKPKYTKVEAFSDSFPKVLETVLNQYNLSNYTESQFQDAKTNFISSIDGELMQRPYMIPIAIKDNILLGKKTTLIEVLAQANSLQLQDFKDIVSEIQSNSRIEVLFYGNVLENQAKSYGEKITGLLQRDSSRALPFEGKVLNIENKNLVYRTRTSALKDELTLTLNYYQGKPVDIRDITALKLITKILDPEAFSYLRTEKKLGYIVALRDDLVGNVTGLKVLVMSSSYDTNQVDMEIENFWYKAENILRDMSSEDLAQISQAFGEGLEYNSKSFRIKGEHVYNHVVNHDYLFGLEDKIKEFLPRITKDDIIRTFEAIVKQPRKLSIQLYSEERADIPQAVVHAESQYSRTEPTIIDNLDSLSSLPRYGREVSI